MGKASERVHERAPAPTRDEWRRHAQRLGIEATPETMESLRQLAASRLEAWRLLEELDWLPPPRTPPTPRGHRPAAREDPLRAWAWKAALHGAPEGPLRGMRVAVKENICVAGMPLQAGSSLLEGFVPRAHATVVERLLAAGASVAGTSACEDLCFSGGSHTRDDGEVRNPHDPNRMAGGSSGGSAALVAIGEVDAALGTDQGGSIAIPSAWCGVVGLKPTHGLVPYTGILPVEPSIDHVGPIARTVADVARLLDALAGPDGADPRQLGMEKPARETSYLDASHPDAAGPIRVALLEEAFGWPDASGEDVDGLVERAVRLAFAWVARASVPEHRDANVLMAAISAEAARSLFAEGGLAGLLGPAFADLADALREGWADPARQPAATVLLPALLGRHVHEHAGQAPVRRAHALRTHLRLAVDEALAGHDVLAFPTVPFKAMPIPPRDAPIADILAAAYTTHNTATFDLTHHPTLTLPAGTSAGLPVGVTFVARRGDEATLLRAGAVFESASG